MTKKYAYSKQEDGFYIGKILRRPKDKIVLQLHDFGFACWNAPEHVSRIDGAIETVNAEDCIFCDTLGEAMIAVASELSISDTDNPVGVQRPDLVCRVVDLSYDFRKRRGCISLAAGNCCDGTGCLELFLRIDPMVQEIHTFAGGEPDTIYERTSGRWKAHIPDSHKGSHRWCYMQRQNDELSRV
jgi:hypothetical protein